MVLMLLQDVVTFSFPDKNNFAKSQIMLTGSKSPCRFADFNSSH
jgi:hypothetical protein